MIYLTNFYFQFYIFVLFSFKSETICFDIVLMKQRRNIIIMVGKCIFFFVHYYIYYQKNCNNSSVKFEIDNFQVDNYISWISFNLRTQKFNKNQRIQVLQYLIELCHPFLRHYNTQYCYENLSLCIKLLIYQNICTRNTEENEVFCSKKTQKKIKDMPEKVRFRILAVCHVTNLKKSAFKGGLLVFYFHFGKARILQVTHVFLCLLHTTY